MAFTTGRWEAYTPHTDGTEYVIQPLIALGTVGFTKVAAGDYAATIGSAVTAVLAYKLPGILRTGEPHLEDTAGAIAYPSYEQYNPPVAPYSIPGTQAGTTLPVLKGIYLQSIDVIYSVTTDALTSISVGVFAKQDTNGASPTVTTLLAQAANGLTTATTTHRNVINVPMTTQEFIITPDSVITAELDIETASGGSADVFGIVFNFAFNYD